MSLNFVSKLKKKVFSSRYENVTLRLNVRNVELSRVRSDEIIQDISEIDDIIENKYGKIVLGGYKAGVYSLDNDSLWGVLSPLFRSKYVQEVFIRGRNIFATIKGRRYRVYVEGFVPEKFISKVIVRSRAKVSYQSPEAEAELEGWRLYFKMPFVSGKWEMSATKLVNIPDFLELVNPLLAARLISLMFKPSTVVIIGPAGSGKTTFLNSLLNKILQIFPMLKVSIIEQVHELNVDSGIVNFSRVNVRDMTTLLRQAIRYERPDLLVVGELRSEEVISWIDVGRNGVATVTTFHSPSLSKAISSMNYVLKRNVYSSSVEDVIDVFVICRKYVLPNNYIKRGIEEIYYNIRGKLFPLFIDGVNLSEEIFMRVTPTKTMFGNFSEIYLILKKRFGYISSEAMFGEFDPIFIDDL